MSTVEERIAALLRETETLGEAKVTPVEEIREPLARYRAFYLEMDAIPGKRVRLYVWLGVPKGGAQLGVQLPAVLHIHGGSQTAYPEQVRYWAERGYVSCSYDWSGPIRERERFSDLISLPGADPMHELDPMRSVMLTRLLIAYRMTNWLARQPEVDADRIGAYGISWGGSILWLLNHYSDKLRAVAPIYGCGRIIDAGRNKRNKRLAHTAREYELWRFGLDGNTLADRQHAPVYMMAATNDFWGWSDAVCDAVARVPEEKISLFWAANEDHRLGANAASSLEAWMNAHLRGGGQWPQMPEAAVQVDGGKLYVYVDARLLRQSGVEAIRFGWSWGDFGCVAPPARHWHTGEADPQTGRLEIPVVDPEEPGYVYAETIGAAGVKIGGLPLRFVPSYEGLKAPTDLPSTVLADFSGGTDGWLCPFKRTEPMDADFRYEWIADPNGGMALGLADTDLPFQLATRKPSDPKWRFEMEGMAVLKCRLFTGDLGKWTIELFHRPEQSGQHSWKHERVQEPGWQTLRLTLDNFSDESGRSLFAWETVQRIDVRLEGASGTAAGRSALGRVEWEEQCRRKRFDEFAGSDQLIAQSRFRSASSFTLSREDKEDEES